MASPEDVDVDVDVNVNVNVNVVANVDVDAGLRARARRAYERAMVLHGLRRVWPLLALVPAFLALHGGTAGARTIAAASTLGLVLALTGWRGGAWRRGALPGVLAGLPAFLVPSLVMPSGARCAHCVHRGVPWMTCFGACLGATLAAGLVLAYLARRDAAPRAYALAAATTAALTAAMTCSLAGGAGLLGISLGLLATSAPVLVFAPR